MQRAPESGGSHANVSPAFAHTRKRYGIDLAMSRFTGMGGWEKELKYLNEDFVREVIDRRHNVASLLDSHERRSEVVLVSHEGRKCAAELAQGVTKLDILTWME